MKKSGSSKPYEEGVVFEVPLRDGSFATGIVARCDGKGLVFGYFFGPKHKNNLSDKTNLNISNAVLLGQFSDLALVDGSWKVLWKYPNWCRTDWPFPEHMSTADDPSCVELATYYPETFLSIKYRIVSKSQVDTNKIPGDSVMGCGFVEARLTKLLGT